MTTLPLAEARNNLSKIVDEVERTHDAVTITRNGRPSAVVISVDDYESMMETFALLDSPEEQASLARAKEEYERGDVVTGDEMAELMRERARRETET
ncbi:MULTISPECIES: type II toxin-antitoxin system Phd/YefM family antitoxin [Nocardiopsis]|uniref:Antitoxin n=1 Tax=Nocardiopsis dassonvillei (strain ATCC 23218 / DSM 43111 / CIP 107115 / JCM 7437 / KCTC 9190 / NBRC 14626 / NCTC 10488 / NRRL B-5397 / IMRU 509) TaxID=446468 RepID=D7B4J3_NOCDD|nr:MULTISPECIES: type II toxin-antitoxin system Phd/YefM family antitoxin [Nocardiopsis]ADH68988.1 prevent-host-death family protein [Nocardiopsis dassonvillei subsp. dassonvillei DSM 43111]APC37032.1 prevent-host-death family protein [Nocardiopsis dassonvillei]NKY82028.1 type II toxin-antitoxin system Phd/YefM family antitoxin [Nocardiopsis dassonvillei]VEI89497.1 Antitoxin RelB [Nocardiopsis dassonvillei]